MSNYYIYEIRNKINNKTYIGQRKCPENKTPETDSYMGSGNYLEKSKKKYGIKNFEKTILISGIESKSKIDELEKEYISKYREIGKAEYNIANGGDGGDTLFYATSEKKMEHKRKIKQIMSSPEMKIKVSLGTKKAFENNPEIIEKMKKSHKQAMNRPEVREKCRQVQIGKHLSEETKRKLRESGKGKNNWSKGRKCYTNGVENRYDFECPEGFHPGRVFHK